MAQIHILDQDFDPELYLAQFRKTQDEATGAVVSFIGVMRGKSETLTLTHYPEFTQDHIAAFAAWAEEKWALSGLLIVHRIGEMKPGEPIVCVASASAHRRAAFEAADCMMDYLKSEAPLWKQEKIKGETLWIEPREDDKSDYKRWTTR